VWERFQSLMRVSNFSLQLLDLVMVSFETLILMKTKCCVCFVVYTMFKVLSGSSFFKVNQV